MGGAMGHGARVMGIAGIFLGILLLMLINTTWNSLSPAVERMIDGLTNIGVLGLTLAAYLLERKNTKAKLAARDARIAQLEAAATQRMRTVEELGARPFSKMSRPA